MPTIALLAAMAVIYAALCRYHDWRYLRDHSHYGHDDIDRVRHWSSPRRAFREMAYLLVFGCAIGFVVGFAIHTRIVFGG